MSEYLFKFFAGIKYGIIEGLLSAVAAGVIADLLSFRYTTRVSTVIICAAVGTVFGLRFGIRLSRFPSENPPGEHFFCAVVLLIGTLDLLIFAASLVTGKMHTNLILGRPISHSYDTISYLFYSALWLTCGILGVGVGLSGLRWPMKLISRFYWGELLFIRLRRIWHKIPEALKIVILFGFVSLPVFVLVFAAIVS
jgi:hypothetical protein